MILGEKMKFAVWGTGIRGNLAVSFLGIDSIKVFIDENLKLSGKTYQGREIVSFEEYRRRFNDCYIIISPSDCAGIIDILNKAGIKYYSILEDVIY